MGHSITGRRAEAIQSDVAEFTPPNVEHVFNVFRSKTLSTKRSYSTSFAVSLAYDRRRRSDLTGRREERSFVASRRAEVSAAFRGGALITSKL